MSSTQIISQNQVISPNQAVSTTGRELSAGAIALMLMLCLSWGFNQIAVKLVLPDVPPMLQALIRSAGALPVLLVIGWRRGTKFFERDGTLWAGLSAGVIFGIEFVLIYRGLLLTTAAPARWCFSTPRRSSWRWGPMCFSASGCAPGNGAGWV